MDAVMATGAEVIVVDNASSDGTVEQVRQRGAAVIANPVNRGFAAAVNQGVRFLGADYILLLNPDAVLQGSLAALQTACAARGAGAAGRQLGDAPGGISAGVFCPPRPPAPGAGVERIA